MIMISLSFKSLFRHSSFRPVHQQMLLDWVIQSYYMEKGLFIIKDNSVTKVWVHMGPQSLIICSQARRCWLSWVCPDGSVLLQEGRWQSQAYPGSSVLPQVKNLFFQWRITWEGLGPCVGAAPCHPWAGEEMLASQQFSLHLKDGALVVWGLSQ